MKQGVSRRSFFGGLAAAVGCVGLRPESLWAQARAQSASDRPFKASRSFWAARWKAALTALFFSPRPSESVVSVSS